MLSCKQVVAHSSDHIDGQLPLRLRLSIRLHLAMCVNCRRFIKQFRLAGGVVRSLPRDQSVELDRLAAKLAELHRLQR